MIGLIIAIAFFVAGKQYAGVFGCNNEVAGMVAFCMIKIQCIQMLWKW